VTFPSAEAGTGNDDHKVLLAELHPDIFKACHAIFLVPLYVDESEPPCGLIERGGAQLTDPVARVVTTTLVVLLEESKTATHRHSLTAGTIAR
jgi:hypothetical protein